MNVYACPTCEAPLQPLRAGSDYLATARDHARSLDLPIPVHGPAVLLWAAFVAHAMVVHDDLDLGPYMEAVAAALPKPGRG